MKYVRLATASHCRLAVICGHQLKYNHLKNLHLLTVYRETRN
jgi:hypothetical protein